jgi:nickel-type superoxide dismutase maturation protease
VYPPSHQLGWLFGRVIVEGSSMEPTLRAGDRLLLVPAVRLRPGHIVAVTDPRDADHLLVKRVKSIDRVQHFVMVEGDNPDKSTDSRVFGPVEWRAVRGRVVYRYAPSARSGPIGGRR